MCEADGGECKRKCNGGVWDFGLECANANRMCCFQNGADVTDAPVVTEAPGVPVDPSNIPGQGK